MSILYILLVLIVAGLPRCTARNGSEVEGRDERETMNEELEKILNLVCDSCPLTPKEGFVLAREIGRLRQSLEMVAEMAIHLKQANRGVEQEENRNEGKIMNESKLETLYEVRTRSLENRSVRLSI